MSKTVAGALGRAAKVNCLQESLGMFVLLTAVFWANVSQAGLMLFSGTLQGQYNRSDRDGSNRVSISIADFLPRAMAFHEATQQVYFANAFPGQIERMNVDGSGRTVVLAGINNPLGFKIDSTTGKMYWIEDGPGNYQDPNGFIKRANLDGTGIETIITGMPNSTSSGFDIDSSGGKIYYTAGAGGIGVKRADLDGANQERIFGDWLANVALDPTNGDIYLGSGSGHIYKGNMDGSGSLAVLANTGSSVSALFADTTNSFLYYTNPNSSPTGRVGRLSFDGTGNSIVYSTVEQATAVTMGNVGSSSAVPEPASLALFGIGGLGLLVARRSRAQVQQRSAKT